MNGWDGNTVEAGAGSYPEPPMEIRNEPYTVCDRCGYPDEELKEFGGQKLCWECYDEAVRATARTASFDDLLAYVTEDKYTEDPMSSRWGDFFRNWCYEAMSPFAQAELIEMFFKNPNLKSEFYREMKDYILQDDEMIMNFAAWMDEVGRQTA